MKKQLLLFTILFCLFTVSLSLITATYGLAAESYLWPVPSSTNISQNYSSSHKALDITGGGNIVATKSGTVVYVYSGCNNVNAASKKVSCSSSTCSPNTGNFYNNSTYGISTCNWGVGNGVVLKHTDGTYSSYSHMASVSVSVGDSVTQGAKLGVMGSSGCSTGTHLHFAISNSMSQSGTWCNFTDPVNNNPTNISYIYSTATPCTTHTKGQYMYYGDNHPHYNYYKCSVCGSIFADGSTHVVDSCLEC
ncbi:MAG: M23 family metallopeptidase, partial [Firmicutes bacterium]|nr:M23 family metallopeptidase [Bacillota bacterium]